MFRRHLPEADLVIIDCRDRLIYQICTHFLLFPFARKPLVAVDLVLRRPDRLKSKVSALLKWLLFSRIDHFIHYFQDLSGYQKYFGIKLERSSYVPFKVNSIDVTIPPNDLREDYIIAVGISLRDYDTYIRAIRELPYPALISEFALNSFEGRSSSFSWNRSNVPSNLTLVPDFGGRESLMQFVAGARIVVIPTQGNSICASGLSSYLDAMYLGKCVVISEGPGTSDLLSNQALLVPPHNVSALREAIESAWENNELRTCIGENGRKYALSLGGERELLDRIFRRSVSAVLYL